MVKKNKRQYKQWKIQRSALDYTRQMKAIIYFNLRVLGNEKMLIEVRATDKFIITQT